MSGAAKRHESPAAVPDRRSIEPPFADRNVQRLYEYWLSKHQDGKLPGRSAIDPLDIPELLSIFVLIDIEKGEDGGLKFRVRLAGTKLVERMGAESTGMLIEEAFLESQAREINAAYRRVVESGAPHCWDYALPMRDREHVRYQRIVCPLASDGTNIDALCGVVSFTND